MAAEERDKRNVARRQVCKHVAWKEPNLAWAIDGTERGKDLQGEKLYRPRGPGPLHQIPLRTARGRRVQGRGHRRASTAGSLPASTAHRSS